MPRTLLTFICVGSAATMAHVIVAITLEALLGAAPQTANLGGYIAAVGLSYLGHGKLTFRVNANHAHHLPRFVTVSLIGLVIGSILVEVLSVRVGVPFWATMLCVAGPVAASTFTLSKFWAFKQVRLDQDT